MNREDSIVVSRWHKVTKVILLALTFAFFTGTQAIWRSLKSSIFSKIIGAAFISHAKVLSIFFLIPLLLGYSKLVDTLRRHQLVYVFTLLHALGGVIFALALMHPEWGLSVTHSSPNRIVGWLFYLFMESFSAFLSTTFWSFANSVNNPTEARSSYGTLVAGSKLGGLICAGSFSLFLAATTDVNSSAYHFFRGSLPPLSDDITLPAALLLGSVLLTCAAIAIYTLMRIVPGYYLHGYEEVYKIEKKRELKDESLWGQLKSSFDGLYVIVSRPYVFGIFMLSFFHDFIITIFDFLVLQAADSAHATAGALTGFYLNYYMLMHLFGLGISLFGTTMIQRFLGNRIALLVYPFACMIAIVATYIRPSAEMFFNVLVILRALNYGLNHPIREVLYIPTTKEIKFKAKAWTDAFGTRIAKSSAATFTIGITNILSTHAAQSVTGAVTFGATVAWIGVSYLLGRKLQSTIDNKQVIGAAADSSK